MLNIPVKDRR